MLSWTKKRTGKNRITRRCIGDTILSLLKQKSLDKITVTDIARGSGISRVTFYHYYASPREALEDYLQEIIAQYVEERRQVQENQRLHSFEDILFTLHFFDQYASLILMMVREGLYAVVIDAVNRFMQEQFPGRRGKRMYELYYYAGALLNLFVKWEEEGKQVSAEEIARIVCRLEHDQDFA